MGLGDSETTPPRTGNFAKVGLIIESNIRDSSRKDENDGRNNCSKYPISAPENEYQEE